YTGPDSVKFKVNDGQCDSNEATVSITVTGGSTPPPVCSIRIAPAGCGMTFSNDGTQYVIAIDGSTACVILDGSGSSDPNHHPLTYIWTVDGTNVSHGATVTNCLPEGCHTITLTVSDGENSSTCVSRLCVISPCEAIEQCIALVERSQVARKNKRPLIATLKAARSEEHTSELQSPDHLVCRLL